ncbi:unnamed protein product [Zymoseptoria tritici ST99CH_3D7]|uniref:BTB domain-containing protein n=1 Tax=Zymoseptoria tritici (strain ST99CH_3D7) TaxID=1276538 RepID=A0A1X7RP67_ZYMT9|nr:unnamed protein product [Zymoseptoria tritici ST99CH_3D7]
MDLTGRLRGFWESGKFSDFTIKCGPHEFQVHKVVISARSPYFEAACSSNSFKEGESAMIELASDKDDPSCDDPEAVKSMIAWFYHDDYEVEKLDRPPSRSTTPSKDDGNALAHARVFAVSVKYDVPSLRTIAVRKFRRAMKVYPEHASVAAAITVAFTTTPDDVRELRDIVSELLVTRKTLLSREDVGTAVNDVPGLALDLARRLQSKLETEKKKEWHAECLSCGNTETEDIKCLRCGLYGDVGAVRP